VQTRFRNGGTDRNLQDLTNDWTDSIKSTFVATDI